MSNDDNDGGPGTLIVIHDDPCLRKKECGSDQQGFPLFPKLGSKSSMNFSHPDPVAPVLLLVSSSSWPAACKLKPGVIPGHNQKHTSWISMCSLKWGIPCYIPKVVLSVGMMIDQYI